MSNETKLINTTLELKLSSLDGDILTTKFKGIKVISFFPKLNTRVCDLQTHNTIALAKKYSDVTFISLTMDSLDIIKNWCAAQEIENALIFSDLKYADFAKKTNYYVKGFNTLKRGLLLLDKNNQVVFISAFISLKMPDFDKLELEIKLLQSS